MTKYDQSRLLQNCRMRERVNTGAIFCYLTTYHTESLVLSYLILFSGGALSNSLALFTDVLHLGSDLISFLVSLLALYLSRKPANKSMLNNPFLHASNLEHTTLNISA